MPPKKLTLQSKQLELTLKEHDWKKLFDGCLTTEMMPVLFSDADIAANKKGILKKSTGEKHRRDNNNNNNTQQAAVPPLTQFFYFLRGLCFELGVGLSKPDPVRAYDAFIQGFEESQDALCAFRLAGILSTKANKANVQVNIEKAIFYLLMSGILLDIQYQASLIDVESEMRRVLEAYEEGTQLPEILFTKYGTGTGLFSAEYKEIYLGLFKLRYNISQIPKTTNISNPTSNPNISIMPLSQNTINIASDAHTTAAISEAYSVLLQKLSAQVQQRGDSVCLTYLFELIVMNIQGVNNKQLKDILETAMQASDQCWMGVLAKQLQQVMELSNINKDHVLLYSQRALFFEIYSFIKGFQYPLGQKKILYPMLFAINDRLYKSKMLFAYNSLHASTVVRIRSEMFEKGIGVARDVQEALKMMNEELQMQKESQDLYAYANYAAAKLKRKTNTYQMTEITAQLNLSRDQFDRRVKSGNNQAISSIVHMYYLGRIAGINSSDGGNAARQYYNEALQLYKSQQSRLKCVKTLQYEIICIKLENKVNQQGFASIYRSKVNENGRQEQQIPQNGNSQIGRGQPNQQQQQQQQSQMTTLQQPLLSSSNVSNNANNFTGAVPAQDPSFLSNNTVSNSNSNSNKNIPQASLLSSTQSKPQQQQLPQQQLFVSSAPTTTPPPPLSNQLLPQSTHLTPPILQSSSQSTANKKPISTIQIPDTSTFRSQPPSPSNYGNLSDRSSQIQSLSFLSAKASKTVIPMRIQNLLDEFLSDKVLLDNSSIVILEMLERGAGCVTSECLILSQDDGQYDGSIFKTGLGANNNNSQYTAAKALISQGNNNTIENEGGNQLSASYTYLRSFKKILRNNPELQLFAAGEGAILKERIIPIEQVQLLQELLNQLSAQSNSPRIPSVLYPIGYSYQMASATTLSFSAMYPVMKCNLYAANKTFRFSLSEKLLIAEELTSALIEVLNAAKKRNNQGNNNNNNEQQQQFILTDFLVPKPQNILFTEKGQVRISLSSDASTSPKHHKNIQEEQEQEENLDDTDEVDSKHFQLGYSPPEILTPAEKAIAMNITNANNPASNQVTSSQLQQQAQPFIGSISSIPHNTNLSSSFMNVLGTPIKDDNKSINSKVSQLLHPTEGSSNNTSPIDLENAVSWSLSMLLNLLFFSIDSGDTRFWTTHRLYAGFNLIIPSSACIQGDIYNLTQPVKNIIEQLGKYTPSARISLADAKDAIQRIYIELTTSQQYQQASLAGNKGGQQQQQQHLGTDNNNNNNNSGISTTQLSLTQPNTQHSSHVQISQQYLPKQQQLENHSQVVNQQYNKQTGDKLNDPSALNPPRSKNQQIPLAPNNEFGYQQVSNTPNTSNNNMQQINKIQNLQSNANSTPSFSQSQQANHNQNITNNNNNNNSNYYPNNNNSNNMNPNLNFSNYNTSSQATATKQGSIYGKSHIMNNNSNNSTANVGQINPNNSNTRWNQQERYY